MPFHGISCSETKQLSSPGPWANPAFQRLPSTGDGRQCADHPGKPPGGVKLKLKLKLK